ncbi:glycoprotein-N-acetylgalactosamine 3-beta-galactosyltransferase 1-like [Plutella xylostella]|uniref:glycoprotein-N-acetylgalactosamine 3-beta-galactosyltransferase 1-like n=1 Tax=Plutella xylostella TaxID=51655 RepID=UPI002032A536|nr:glycoprotein-N-acetylgalactosamine 3-beta-galactosyltransferase 1-like [Plutella xylostella]
MLKAPRTRKIRRFRPKPPTPTPPPQSQAYQTFEAHQSFELAHSSIDHRVADDLARAVRVLCWVATRASRHQPRAAHARATWGRRCTRLLFMSTENIHQKLKQITKTPTFSTIPDSWLPAIKLNVTDGPDYLWGKTREAFMYVYKHHYHDADWFLKAEDDTYVIVENLRFMLSSYNSSEPLYFGQRMRQPDTPQGFMSGGAGYVLSKGALKKFALEAYPSPDLCNQQPLGLEDVEMGYCLSNVGVRAMDSRDSYGRGRFFTFPAIANMFPNTTYGVTSSPYWKHTYYKAKEGINCCSDFAISFHKVDAKWLYILEYFLYHLRPYGINYIHDPSDRYYYNERHLTDRYGLLNTSTPLSKKLEKAKTRMVFENRDEDSKNNEKLDRSAFRIHKARNKLQKTTVKAKSAKTAKPFKIRYL